MSDISAQAWRDFTANTALLEREGAGIHSRYLNKWIGIYKGQVEAVADSFDGVYAGTSLRPMIEAHISIPSINAGGFVHFLIDTGADTTTITPNDGRRLRIDYTKLTIEDHALGYSGATIDFICSGIVKFANIGVMEYEYNVYLRITKPDPEIPELLILPSLLGRDIINRWQLSFDPQGLMIKANILSCDKSTSLALR